MKPRVTRQQQLGKIGESIVAHNAIENGFIFHPIESGNDFGIDGRLECVGVDGVEAHEFFVQIKTSEEVTFVEGGTRLRLKPIKVSTAAYWASKLSPTLLVVVCAYSKRLWQSWAHEAISGESLISAVRNESKCITPIVPSTNDLDSAESWKSIAHQSGSAYWSIVDSIYQSRTKNDFLKIYRAVADGYEILTSRMLDQTEQTDSERLPVEQITTAILLYRGLDLLQRLTEFPKDELDVVGQRLLRVTTAAAQTVRDAYLEMYSDQDEDYQRSAEVALYGHPKLGDKMITLSAPQVRLDTGLNQIASVARDYLRILRMALFPQPPQSDPPNPLMWLDQMAKAWLDPPPPADERHGSAESD